MATPREVREDKLVVRRVMPASRENVFAAWTDPKSMGKWMRPRKAFTAEVESDARVGGKYRIVMKGPERDYDHEGEFKVVEPPSKLVFTWTSEGTDRQTTLVTVELFESGKDQCELVLTHERFPRPDNVPAHSKGWAEIADNLAEYLQTQG